MGADSSVKPEEKERGGLPFVQISFGCALKSTEERLCGEEEEGLRECGRKRRSVERGFKSTPPPRSRKFLKYKYLWVFLRKHKILQPPCWER